MLVRENIKDIYTLSPMQEGMYFQSLITASKSVATEVRHTLYQDEPVRHVITAGKQGMECQ